MSNRQYEDHSVENERFTLTEKIFRQINYLVILLVKPLLSRNFCQKRVRVNFRNFHTVSCGTVLSSSFLLEKIFREIVILTSKTLLSRDLCLLKKCKVNSKLECELEKLISQNFCQEIVLKISRIP